LSVPIAEILVVTCEVWVAITESFGARVAATSWDTRELTLMTDPPAAALVAVLLVLAMETGVLVLLTVLIGARLLGGRIRLEKAAGWAPCGAHPLASRAESSTRGSLHYGSFCNRVRMFCGMVLA
jgi:hypothetical protein